MDEKKKMTGKETGRQIEVSIWQGLKKYRDQGIPILIDGKELPEEDWNKIFEIREDNSFYMADYIPDGKTGKLREIRFDRVYNR
uniref:hypothetical protein n=1 Tax=Clostridium sp. NkU-1 TaxID=1095009 RepID=UPI0006D16FAF